MASDLHGWLVANVLFPLQERAKGHWTGAVRRSLEKTQWFDAKRLQALQLTRLRQRLAERGITLELTEEAKEAVAEAGWDPTYGARPLKRALQRMIENPLALRLLEGDFTEGDTVVVDVEDGELGFDKAHAAAVA